MAVADRTRRPSPAVLLPLALLICLFGGTASVAASAGAASADRAAIAALPASAHAVARGSDAGAQSRVSQAPSIVAVFFAALAGARPASWWSARSGAAAGPAAGGRFACYSRAPPGGRPLPA
jgi:hypothetical protein